MQCCFCDKPVASIEEAIDLGWCPDFWNEDLQYQGPVCPECQCEHLETDEDGEFELKTGHSLPPFVVRQCHAPLKSSPFDIKCMFCGTKVDNIEPFCPACKQEHFMRNEDGEEVLKPGHEMPPSWPLSILNDPPILDPLEIRPGVRPKFELGQIVATSEALDAITDAKQMPDFFLEKHVQGDWGEVGTEDKLANDQAVTSGERILSAYRTLLNKSIWIITDATDEDGNRAATTITLPGE